MRLAVVMFNLGGPDSPEAVEPFLRNLFSDPAIIALPGLLRKPLARLLASRRAPVAREIYAKIGGRSPILEETQAQGAALEQALARQGQEARAFVAMRCWRPFSDETAAAVKAWAPERIVLLPLYPQFSTTTTASSLGDWRRACAKVGLERPQSRVCCYPGDDGFVAALVSSIRETWAKTRPGLRYRLLLSAHGLPERVIASGDPYRWQVELSAKAVVARLGIEDLDWRVCYQSRVGPLTWIRPATDAEIRGAGAEAIGVVVAPLAFVSDHSETLVELDIEYAELARAHGVADYLRAPVVGVRAAFIEGLARLVIRAAETQTPATCGDGRICPGALIRCGFEEMRR